MEGHVAVHHGAHVRKRMAVGILQMIGVQAVTVRAGWVGRDLEATFGRAPGGFDAGG